MTERARNLAVGITILIGLVLLAVLMFAFAGLPEVFQTGNKIHMLFDQTYDLESGAPVYLRGKKVGVITEVNFTDGDLRKGITITARIDSDIRLPRNIQAKAYTRGLVGKGYLSLQPGGPMPKGATGEYFNPNETITLRGVHDTSAGLLPPQLTQAFEDFGKLAKNLNELIAPEPPTSQPTTQPLPPGLQGSVARLNRTLDALYAISGDTENQDNIKTSLANLSAASAKAIETMEALKAFLAKGETTLAGANELTRKLIIDAEDISKLLLSIRKTVDNMNAGEGTAGKLMNDPKLYDNLVKLSVNMDQLVSDFRRLAKKWETQGMGVKLK